jgi:hypothetical protein
MAEEKDKPKIKKTIPLSGDSRVKWHAEGINFLSEHTGLPVSYLKKNINKEELTAFADKRLAKRYSGEDYNPNHDKKLKKDIVEHIGKGNALNYRTRQVVKVDDAISFTGRLKGFLGGESGISRVHKEAHKLKGLKDLVESEAAYKKLTPALATSLGKVHELQYGKNILNVAKADHILSKGEYKTLDTKLEKAAENYATSIKGHIDAYITKIAASVIALFGVLTLVSQMKLTGAVIGSNLSFSGAGLYGLGLILIGLAILGFKKLERK